MRIGQYSILFFCMALNFPLFAMPESWQDGSGSRVLYIPAEELKMVDIRLLFAAGSARDGDAKGLARLSNSLLKSGAADLSEQDFEQQLRSLGSELNTGSLRDMGWISLRSLSESRYLQPSLELLEKLLNAPQLPAHALERIRKQMQVSLQAQQQSPAALAQKTFYKALYGNHPYASPPDGTEESLEQITIQDVRNFWHRFYNAQNAIIAVVGNISKASAHAIGKRLSAAMPRGEKAPLLPPPAATESQQIQLPFPSSQTHILIGTTTPTSWDHPDTAALSMASELLGGGFGSILLEELREKRGWVYSAHSVFQPMASGGLFRVQTQTKNTRTEAALALVRKQLQQLYKQPPQKSRLADTTAHMLGRAALRGDSNRKRINYLAQLGFYDLPLDYLPRRDENIGKLSAKAVHKAFKRHINPANLIAVIVGGISPSAAPKP